MRLQQGHAGRRGAPRRAPNAPRKGSGANDLIPKEFFLPAAHNTYLKSSGRSTVAEAEYVCSALICV